MEDNNETKQLIQSMPFVASAQLDKLFAALSKAQANMGAAKKDKSNPFFKSSYADLESCWDAIKIPFTEQGLSIIQLPMEGINTVKLQTVLCHSSGQYITSIVEVKPSKNDPQGTGSALTYARRYGLMAICGIAPEDDDGNAASGKQGYQKAEEKKVEEKKKEIINSAPSSIRKDQIEKIRRHIGTSEWTNENIKDLIAEKYKAKAAKDLSEKQGIDLINYIINNIPQGGVNE